MSYIATDHIDEFLDVHIHRTRRSQRRMSAIPRADRTGRLVSLMHTTVQSQADCPSGAYPLISALMERSGRTLGGYNLGGVKCVLSCRCSA